MARTHFGLLALVAVLHVARLALGEPEGAAKHATEATLPSAAPGPVPAPPPGALPGTPPRAGPEQAPGSAPAAAANTDVAAPAPVVTPPPDPARTAGPPADAVSAPGASASLSTGATGTGGVGAPPTDALIHLAINYGPARLEARSLVDAGDWRALCDAPCDRSVHVEGEEMRVTAIGMTPSNPFLVAPGPGTARFRVSGGSATARTVGIVGLAGGLPITFAGVSIFGLGSVHENSAERTAGLATLVVGAVITLASLPCLLAGSTSVRNEQGKYIARGGAEGPLL